MPVRRGGSKKPGKSKSQEAEEEEEKEARRQAHRAAKACLLHVPKEADDNECPGTENSFASSAGSFIKANCLFRRRGAARAQF